MRTPKWMLSFLGLALLFALFHMPPISHHERDDAQAEPFPHDRQDDVSVTGADSRMPSHVSVRMKSPMAALITGESGSFELEAGLKPPRDPSAAAPRWNLNADNPLVVWISTRQDSGIRFIDEAHPDRPYHHLPVKFTIPAGSDSRPLTASVPYSVSPRTSAGAHTFWMDVYGELLTPDGNEIQDTGIITLAFDVDTHLMTKLEMLLVIAAAVFLFIVEWVRVDVVAIAMMVLLPELGLLDVRNTFDGISSNAVMAIIGVMIISNGLNRAGLVNRIIQPLIKYTGDSPRRVTVLFSSLIAGISGVMQNTGAAVLFLPAIRLVTSHRLKIHISRVLMPIGMAAILGGTLTMIGTSPLILLNDILPPEMPKFGFLELTPIALAIVIGGIAYLCSAGTSMLARLPRVSGREGKTSDQAPAGILDAYPLIEGPFEVHVPEDYRPGEQPQEVVQIRRRFMVNIVAIAKSNSICKTAPLPETTVQPGQCLCIYGPEKAVSKFVADYGLVLRSEPRCFKDNMFNPSIAGVVEGVVSPRSRLIGKTIKELRFRETFGVNALAIHQSGRNYYRELADRHLESGDAVIMQGTWEQFHALQDLHENLIIITSFEEEFHRPEKARPALICFLVALAMMLVSSFYFQGRPYNPIPLSVCLMVGAVGMVLTGVITINEAYRAVDWRTVFLLGGLIPLGMAVDQTGTAKWIAGGIIAGLGTLMSPLLLLITLAVLSCAFTMVISNVGACTLLIPLGISLARQIGIDPRVAAIVVGLGVSNSFMLPTHQVNALYMGPGEYRTRDYIKIGGGLTMIYIAILVTMTYALYL